MLKKILAVIILLSFVGGGYYYFFGRGHTTIIEPTIAQNSRLIKPLNHNWQFIKASGDVAYSLPKSKWKYVSLPHTWNAKDGQDGGGDYYRGTGTYKRTFTLDDSFKDKNIYLHFDGATTTAAVFINGKQVGQHQGNYAAFRFDISQHVKFNQPNKLVVSVNNQENANIAPLSADFTFFGGLYRRARLIATDKIHLQTMNYASSGVFWAQSDVSKQQATLDISSAVVNDTTAKNTVTVTSLLRDKQGQVVSSKSQQMTLEPGETVPYQEQLTLDNPQLWHGLTDPYLYSAEVAISHNDQLIDQVHQTQGLRFFSVDKDQGFMLNGQAYPLYGINRMADFPNKGSAVNDEDHERDIQLILELGATAVRLGHQQRDQYVYQRADETGLIIWAEVPLINRINTNKQFSANVKQQTLELVRQNYNHSAIMFWGLFNEITLKKGPDPRPLVKELNQLVKQEDPNRLTTAAVAASGEHALEDPLATTTDLTSFNRYYGWYYGDFSDFTHFMDDARASAPNLRVAISEYGAGASEKIHSDTPVIQDHSEEYQAIYHENYWNDLKDRPYVWGKFLWVLADFAVDSRDEGDTPGRNDKGLVTFDRKIKKDAFFWYKANWSSQPTIHITSRRFAVRNSEVVAIKVYTNQPEVELFVNGISLGIKPHNGEHKIIWSDVKLNLGDNEIIAKSPSTNTRNSNSTSDAISLTRVNSNDTKITSTTLGIDSHNGKIYNLPHGLTFKQLGTVLKLPQGSKTTIIQAKSNSKMTLGDSIKVIAQDSLTTQDYTLADAPISDFKATSASAQIAAPLSIGPIDIPIMSAAMANDGIITEMVDDMDEVNLWNAMGKGPHWWKVDLGQEYYLNDITIAWPQHIAMLETGPMSYSVEAAPEFEQTFDKFSESYQTIVDQRDNKIADNTNDKLGIIARFIRVRLHKTGVFADTPMLGKYPIYGAEEITINGGLIGSKSLRINYITKTINLPTRLSAQQFLNQLSVVQGAVVNIIKSDGALAKPSDLVSTDMTIDVISQTNSLREHYIIK